MGMGKTEMKEDLVLVSWRCGTCGHVERDDGRQGPMELEKARDRVAYLDEAVVDSEIRHFVDRSGLPGTKAAVAGLCEVRLSVVRHYSRDLIAAFECDGHWPTGAGTRLLSLNGVAPMGLCDGTGCGGMVLQDEPNFCYGLGDEARLYCLECLERHPDFRFCLARVWYAPWDGAGVARFAPREDKDWLVDGSDDAVDPFSYVFGPQKDALRLSWDDALAIAQGKWSWGEGVVLSEVPGSFTGLAILAVRIRDGAIERTSPILWENEAGNDDPK